MCQVPSLHGTAGGAVCRCREMRALLRRYPDFPDMRAALAAAQWAAGREGDAETNWQRVEDPRWVAALYMHACMHACMHILLALLLVTD